MGELRELVDKAWEILESREFDRLGEVYADDAEFTMPGASVRGPDQIRPFVEAYFNAVPDLRHEIITCLESGDTIVTELHITGTHKEPMRTPEGEIPASGNRLDFQSVDVINASGGKITSWRAYFDQLTFLTQLGAMPPK